MLKSLLGKLSLETSSFGMLHTGRNVGIDKSELTESGSKNKKPTKQIKEDTEVLSKMMANSTKAALVVESASKEICNQSKMIKISIVQNNLALLAKEAKTKTNQSVH